MKTARCILLCLSMLGGGLAHGQSPQQSQGGIANAPERAVYALMILDDSPAVSILAAQSVSLFFPGDQELTDLMSERLLRGWDRHRNFNQAASWYAKVIGETGNVRYRSVLASSRSLYKHSGVQRSVDVALQSVSADRSPALQYTLSSFDLEGRRRELRARIPAPTQVSSAIKPGSALVEVISQLGAPDAFSAVVLNAKQFGADPQLGLHFAGLGFVLHRSVSGDGRRWRVTQSHNELLPMPAIESAALDLAQYMVSLRGATFMDFVRSNVAYLRNDPHAVDLVAKRAALFPTPLDQVEDQAMAIALEATFADKWEDPAADPTLQGIAATYTGVISREAALDLMKKLKRDAVRARRKAPRAGKQTESNSP